MRACRSPAPNFGDFCLVTVMCGIALSSLGKSRGAHHRNMMREATASLARRVGRYTAKQVTYEALKLAHLLGGASMLLDPVWAYEQAHAEL